MRIHYYNNFATVFVENEEYAKMMFAAKIPYKQLSYKR